MRPIWSGAISFGLVNIPVRLYSAIEERQLKFHLFHKKDHGSIRYARVCRVDGHEIPFEDIEKGYEYRKGDYVMMADEDFEKANAKKTKTIEINQFVLEKEIDPIYFVRPYYLESDKGSEKAYLLFREALRSSKKVAVARFVLRNKEHLAILKPTADLIVLEELRFQDEVRPAAELDFPKQKEAPKKELEMAIKLIDQLSGSFQPNKYHDTYAKEMEEIIKRKAKGETVVMNGALPRPTKIPDLMEVLAKSLRQTKKPEQTRKKVR